MGRNKKIKSQHLSEAEIWDDSALIRSWDEAVAEYEYYHSIHAKGEDVEEVLRRAELEEIANNKDADPLNGKLSTTSRLSDAEIDYEDGEIEGEEVEDSKESTGAEDQAHREPGDGQPDTSQADDVGNTQRHSKAPNAPIQDSNQILENIKMAYWWAGYYSGLYEAQQQREGAQRA